MPEHDRPAAPGAQGNGQEEHNEPSKRPCGNGEQGVDSYGTCLPLPPTRTVIADAEGILPGGVSVGAALRMAEKAGSAVVVGGWTPRRLGLGGCCAVGLAAICCAGGSCYYYVLRLLLLLLLL